MGFPISAGWQRHGRLPKFAFPAANSVDFFRAWYRNVVEDCELTKVATNRKAQCRADFAHSQGTQVCYPPPQSILRNCDRVVQIDRASRFHSVVFIQNYFGRDASDGGGDRCDRDSRQISNCAVASEHNDPPSLVGRSKLIQSDIPPDYSAGHAASASQVSDSSAVCGCSK